MLFKLFLGGVGSPLRSPPPPPPPQTWIRYRDPSLLEGRKLHTKAFK